MVVRGRGEGYRTGFHHHANSDKITELVFTDETQKKPGSSGRHFNFIFSGGKSTLLQNNKHFSEFWANAVGITALAPPPWPHSTGTEQLTVSEVKTKKKRSTRDVLQSVAPCPAIQRIGAGEAMR